MRYWDSSAIIPLLIDEAESRRMTALYEKDPALITWWGTAIECVSALSRLDRGRPALTSAVDSALTRLSALEREWHEVQPGAAVRATARRLLRVHTLSAADALQLAAAIAASESRPETLALVSLDRRLVGAAHREGFTEVLGPR